MQNKSPYCQNEFETLQTVIVCEPHYMRIEEIINETQEEYVDENINRTVAMQQHEHFVETLQNEGVRVIKIPHKKNYPEQVFTRDIGFTIGNHLYIAEMANSIRDGEEQILIDLLIEHDIPYKKLSSHQVEGGDVIINEQLIYVGQSDRTSSEAIEKLKNELPDYSIIPIKFNEKYLHLDCVFNILSPTEALIFPEAMDEETVNMLASTFNLIVVTEDEQFTMGTNVLSIGQKKVISLPMNKKVNRQLRERGFHVIEVDLSEIIKSGGAFRCCTLPVKRG